MSRQKTESGINRLQCLGTNLCIYIIGCLDDHNDLVRVSGVSRFWRQLVIANGLAKQLFIKKIPKIWTVNSVEVESKMIDSVDVETNTPMEWRTLERDHNVYTSLLQAIMNSKLSDRDCIVNAVSASSTENYPVHSVVNTLHMIDRLPSYWSSKGQSDPQMPETLIYKLRAGIWVITRVDIKPFEAYFQQGNPVYSAKSARIRIGHPREIGRDLPHLSSQEPADDKFVWTYTSPKFPMVQRYGVLKLPVPVLCKDGYLQIELLGRVQRQANDGLFYIRMHYVGVRGRPLFPAFDVETVERDGKMILKYYPEYFNTVMRNYCRNEFPHLRDFHNIAYDRVRLLREYLWELQHQQ